MEDLKIDDKHKSELLEKETAFIKGAEIAYVRSKCDWFRPSFVSPFPYHPTCINAWMNNLNVKHFRLLYD